MAQAAAARAASGSPHPHLLRRWRCAASRWNGELPRRGARVGGLVRRGACTLV
jgi:hypothetical protein